jgi:ribosomal protein L40E
MSDELVTVATSLTVAEGKSAQLLLESEGIVSLLTDVESVMSNVTGLMKLQVRRESADQAIQILADMATKRRQHAVADPLAEPEGCLACGATLTEGATSCPRCGWTFLSAVEGQPAPDDELIEH